MTNSAGTGNLLGYLAAVERSMHAIQIAAIDHLITLEHDSDAKGVANLLQLLDKVSKVLWPSGSLDPRQTVEQAHRALSAINTLDAAGKPTPLDHCIPPWVHIGDRCVYDPNG